MRAMVLEAPHKPLVYRDLPLPVVSAKQVLIKVIACGVCRTDLHIVDGELTHPGLPLIPGHEIIGTVVEKGPHVHTLKEDDIVGVPWWHIPVDTAGTVCNKKKTCARMHYLPDTLLTEAMQHSLSPMRIIAYRLKIHWLMLPEHRCCARVLSAIAHIV